jgi:hypothetical protein
MIKNAEKKLRELELAIINSMEVIRKKIALRYGTVGGYTDEEIKKIAEKYIWIKQDLQKIKESL